MYAIPYLFIGKSVIISTDARISRRNTEVHPSGEFHDAVTVRGAGFEACQCMKQYIPAMWGFDHTFTNYNSEKRLEFQK